MNLNELEEIWDGLPLEKRYTFIKKLKAFTNSRPDLKSQKGHPIFFKVIRFHLGILEEEKASLRKLYLERDDAVLDYLSDSSDDYLVDYQYFQTKITERIEEIDERIEYYNKKIEERKKYGEI